MESTAWLPMLSVQLFPMQNVSGVFGRSGSGTIMLVEPVVPQARAGVVPPPSWIVLAWMILSCVVHWNVSCVWPAMYWSVPRFEVLAVVLTWVVCFGGICFCSAVKLLTGCPWM